MKQDQSPGFYFLAFAFALAAALIVAALVSPAIQTLIAPVRQAPLHRVFSRLAELGLFVGTWWLLRRLRLFDRSIMGYAAPARIFIPSLLAGFLAGVVFMTVAIAPLFAVGLRDFRPGPDPLLGLLATHAPGALVTGLSVALVEETYFRGALQGAMSRRGAPVGVFIWVPALYAAVHFLGEAVRIPTEEVEWSSGFVVLRSFFNAYGSPAEIADAFVALFFVGMLLAIVRHRLGGIAACIGLHAGFVVVISLMRRVSVHVEGTPWAWLVGPYDGLLGLWIATLAALACVVTWRWLPAPAQNGLAITK